MLPPVLEAAATAGVPRLEPEPGHLLSTLADFHTLRRVLGDPEPLGLTLDIGHCQCLRTAPPADCARAAAPWLRHVQIEDMRRGVHEHLPFGDGEIDFPPVLEALAATGHQGLTVVELPRPSPAGPRFADLPPVPPRAAPASPPRTDRSGDPSATHRRERHDAAPRRPRHPRPRTRTPPPAAGPPGHHPGPRPARRPAHRPRRPPRRSRPRLARPGPRRGRRPPRRPRADHRWELRLAEAGRRCGPAHADAARVLILHAARADADALTRVYQQGTADERRAVLHALPHLVPGPEALPLVEDALRTNDTRLLAAALGPYAARHLDAHAWRHAVLKCLFTGVGLDRVADLARRARGDGELARMLTDYAAERTAAGRPVPEDLHRVLALTESATPTHGTDHPHGKES
ncbi:hypothetical protein SGRIM128S_09753 [Streptomyces griseomycini]